MTCTDAELVDKVCKGDMDAFSVLIGKYSNAVYGVAYGKLGVFIPHKTLPKRFLLKPIANYPT
ncbi:hypothetical protein [Paenibacillus odorifer]|uniref:hypothetical protein n=1 Tax=Paenibacillus odorifer TaxID=189426 RepID=UPI0004F75BC1|nr:hypothetical protein [Paenibacillus odorifer]AIQ77076.1 hypothetical protein PODO_29775 [Paenibacillus odorifer]